MTSSCNMIARDNYKIIQAIFFVMLAGCSKAVGGVHLLRVHSQKYSGTLGQETNKTHSKENWKGKEPCLETFCDLAGNVAQVLLDRSVGYQCPPGTEGE